MQLASIVHQVDDLGRILHQERIVEFLLTHNHFSEVLNETFSCDNILIIESALLDDLRELLSKLWVRSEGYIGDGSTQESTEVLPLSLLGNERFCDERTQKSVQCLQRVQDRVTWCLQDCVRSSTTFQDGPGLSLDCGLQQT